MTTRAQLAGRAFAWALRLQALTWRRRSAGLEQIDALITAHRRILIVFWHGKYLPLFVLFPMRGGCVFTTRSSRGEVISEICRRFGHRPVEVTEHDRDAALEAMRQALYGSRMGATAADGPLGPYHEVKHGVIQLASQTGSTILPVSVASRRKWILSKRWDRMEIPRSFTHVYLAAGEPIDIPPALDAAAIHTWSGHVRAALDALDERVEEATRTSPAIHSLR